MPSVNGNHYRTFGQGYRAEKDKAGSKPASGNSDQTGGNMEDAKVGGSDVTAIKDHGDGSYSVKHPSGEISKHDSKEDLMSHLDQHFGGESEDVPDDSGMDSDYGSEGASEAVRSILG